MIVRPVARSETPPRTWGRPFSGFTAEAVSGNTPTYVGKTFSASKYEDFREKHPHVRGEDRGRVLTSDEQDRNTPTYVGKTEKSAENPCPVQKHPHVRGEDPTFLVFGSRLKETPPRTWGRPHHLGHEDMKKGNTPTYVGKTGIFIPAPEDSRKHPHVRGEDGNFSVKW